MINKKTFLSVLMMLVLSIGLAHAAPKESAYDRVMRTGVLRCGFFEEVPFTNVDPNTNNKTGIAVELAENIAQQYGLKIEWTPVIIPTLVTDLQNGRYDAICGSLFGIAARAARVDSTTPYLFAPVYGYVTKGDKRFDGGLEILNDPKYTISILDGEASTAIATRLYPEAKQYALPQNAQVAEVLVSLASKKADIAFVPPSVFKQFDKNNPNVLQAVKTKDPFYVFSVSFGVRKGETKLKDMLNFIIGQMILSGEMDRLVDKYEEVPNTFLRVQKPYR